MKIQNIELKNILLWIGVLFIISGTIFFFAYNWSELNKFIKLSLMLVFMSMAILTHLYSKKSSILSQVSLWLAIMSIGIELAIFGQVYQTGADAYNLFVMWSIFSFTFVLVSYSSINWFTYLILLNLTLCLYITQTMRLEAQDVLSILTVLSLFTISILYFVIKKKELVNFSWIYKVNLVYLLCLVFAILMIDFIDHFSYYSCFVFLYLFLIYHIKEKESILIESISVLSLVFLIPALLSNSINNDIEKIYLGTFTFIISSLVAIRYLVSKVKTSDITFKYSFSKLPWMTHMFIFVVSILAALSILLVFGLMGMFTNKESILISSIILLLLTLSVRKKQHNSLNWYYGFLVSILLSEIGLFLGLSILENNDLFFNIDLPIFCIGLLQILLFVAIKDYIHRIMNIVILSLTIVFVDDVLSAYINIVLLLLILTSALIILNYSKKEFNVTKKVIHDGFVISIFILSCFITFDSFIIDNSFIMYKIIFQVLSSLLLLYISYKSIKKYELQSVKFIILICIVIVSISFIPMITSIVTLLVISLHIKQKTLTVISLLFIIYSVSLWYYNIEISLFYKSIYMICAGVSLLVFYYFLNKKGKICEI